jgi:hypothetical protein
LHRFVERCLSASGFLLAESKHATKEEAQTIATKAADFLKPQPT